MIIWLASYPKSGNTWIRLFIDALLNKKNSNLDLNNIKIRQFPLRYDFTKLNLNPDNINEFVSNCILCQDKINLDNSVKIFKTHNSMWRAGENSFTNDDNTKGVIHIVRDPRNVITSVKNHFSRDDYDDAFQFLTNEKQSLGSRINKKDTDLPTVVSSWSNHYNSWKKMKKNYLLIKYENLINNTFEEFNKIVNYLNENLKIKFDINEINNAIEKCNFNNLKKLESENGFKESAKDKSGNLKKFFYLGPNNDWRTLLDKKTINSLENIFKKEMIELGYL
jgi:hypothetical protein